VWEILNQSGRVSEKAVDQKEDLHPVNGIATGTCLVTGTDLSPWTCIFSASAFFERSS
jgi:hypothetical protein